MEELINKNEFWEIVLNGMSFTRYLAMVLFALIGALILFFTDVSDAVKHDKRSPDKFNIRYMIKTGWPRFIVGMLLILVLIPHFTDLLSMVLKVDEPMEMVPAVALFLGINADLLAKKLVGAVRDRFAIVTKRNQNNGG